MPLPPTHPYTGRDKRGDVAFHVILAVLGGAAALWGMATVPAEQLWLRALIGNGVWGVVLSVGLVAAMVDKDHLPPVRRTVVDGQPAHVLRTWDQKWWHTCGFDLGLLCTGIVMVVAGLAVGGKEGTAALVLAPVGLWFHVRFVLVALGRRRRQALWVTPDAVVLDTANGRARAPLHALVDVRLDDVGRVVLDAPGAVEWQPTPRVWRERAVPVDGDALTFDPTLTAHSAADLVVWLRARILT
ncbi:MAG: hypothetical protein ACI379_16245 [Nocardioides sp.]|uniref:hypothetical protein n=1 Tax=Nocardioides sp. TaxID=35761 RepID=UPI003F0A45F0